MMTRFVEASTFRSAERSQGRELRSGNDVRNNPQPIRRCEHPAASRFVKDQSTFESDRAADGPYGSNRRHRNRDLTHNVSTTIDGANRHRLAREANDTPFRFV
jgi:hypothetical protein